MTISEIITLLTICPIVLIIGFILIKIESFKWYRRRKGGTWYIYKVYRQDDYDKSTKTFDGLVYSRNSKLETKSEYIEVILDKVEAYDYN